MLESLKRKILCWAGVHADGRIVQGTTQEDGTQKLYFACNHCEYKEEVTHDNIAKP